MEPTPWSSYFSKKVIIMLIGELSRLSGFSRDTIRYYEKEGLIKLGKKQRRANNYKDYPEEVLKKLLLIRHIKDFGFTLDETGDLIALIEESMASCETVNKKVATKIRLIDEKIQELQQVKKMLLRGVALCLQEETPSRERACSLLIPKAANKTNN